MFGQQRRYSPVVWDYHVILIVDRLEVYDFDTVFGFPENTTSYINRSFPPDTPNRLSAQAKLIPVRDYLEGFYSDRRHMLDRFGEYRAEPPPWPAIRPEMGSNIDQFINMADGSNGHVLPIGALASYLQSHSV